jgi:hypothetical protein
MWKYFVDRYVPMGLLPRSYNFEQQFRFAFEHSTGRTIEHAFDVAGVDRKKIPICIKVLDEQFGEQMFSGIEEQTAAAFRDSIFTLLEFLANGGKKP